jgi:recombination protein RecT
MSNNAIQTISGDIYAIQQRFESINTDKGINFLAEAEFAIQILQRNDYALKTAMQNRQSVQDAVTNIAAIGLSLNPAKRQAYLVPRDGRLCLDISYIGLMDLAMQTGAIKWAQCALVYANDEFALAGMDQQPVHKFAPFAKDRGDVVGVYAVVKTSDGDYLTHTMPIDDVFAIRDKTQAWRAFMDKKVKSCPWADHEGEMIKKTCIKQASKYWPRGENTARLEAAIQYLNERGGEGLAAVEDKNSGGIRPTDGMMESMSIEAQNYLRELAEELKLLATTDDAGAVIDRVAQESLSNDEMVALWSRLPAQLRAAIKEEKAARAQAAEALQN